ncbi:hypothetical protein BT93_D0425 [Corymbia citriodora subsp. variegata]|nr:hypothetical protein BT93_D0425 [Corymbia citriodora subsp. variegata]KAF8031214.1 hypothetical protein BT93_D0425 [Corymbia citriodora subsp. variegata]
MISPRPLNRNCISIVNQVLAVIIQDREFDAKLAASAKPSSPPWDTESVSEVLRSIPRCFFQSPRSIGRQRTFRHRAPLRQRNLRRESEKLRQNKLLLGPAAHRDPQRVELGLDKALEFYYWVESHFGFVHNEMTCREMAIVLARGNRLKDLWEFLKAMDKRGNELVTTPTITCLIKVLGEEGFVKEAMAAFYRMKQFCCKPDVYAYNTILLALCRVGNFKKARFFLEQMELPGFRKAIRRRMWEANHLFRHMLFKGFVPDVITYNCLIDGCCKTNRIGRALELFDDMNKRGCIPNRVTYNSFIRYYGAVNEIDRAIEMLRKMQSMNHGIPTSSSYTPIIHALCEAGRVIDACSFLIELVDGGSVPREYTYKLVCDALNSSGASGLIDGNLHRKIQDDVERRLRQVMNVKPMVTRQLF